MDVDSDASMVVDAAQLQQQQQQQQQQATAAAAAAAASSVPQFAPVDASMATGGGAGGSGGSDVRSVHIPNNRYGPLHNSPETWMKIYTPLVNHMHLQVRMNVRTRCVELRAHDATADVGALQKGADFVRAFALGFDVDDAVALLRLDDLYVETFEIDDVKHLGGDHLSRAIARVAGKDGKTKFSIENATRTRIVLADRKVHILGSFKNIRLAREAIVDLILGAPPGKVNAKLRSVSSRAAERF